MPYQSFEELVVWQKARELKRAIRLLVQGFPGEEKYRLTDQIIRSSRSVGTQIAEGHGRRTFPGRIRFCIIARGSLSETESHLLDALDESIVTEKQFIQLKEQVKDVERLLNGIYHLVRKQHLITKQG